MHKLLATQLKRHLGGVDSVPIELQPLLASVDEAYRHADEDRLLLERSLELTSQELLARNAQMRREIGERGQQEKHQRDRADRLRLQNEALVELAKSHKLTDGDLPTALQSITEMAARYLDVARASVWLYSEDRASIVCADLYRLYDRAHTSGSELNASDFPAYFRAMERARTIAADEAQTHPDTREFTDAYLIPTGITSMLDACIRRNGRTLGVICHEHIGLARSWSMEEELFAASLADMISLAMESAELRKAEGNLANSLSLLQATFDSTTDGILAVDEQKRIVSFNRRFVEMWQVPDQIMATRACSAVMDFMAPQLADPEEFQSKVSELCSLPDAESFEVIECTDGRFYERVSRPQRVNGVSSGRVWSFHDITESRHAQDELLRAKRLEAAGQLAGQIAHDFNNLLGPIVAYPDILRHILPPNERMERILREMESAAKQIVEINQQLLTLGRRGHYNVETVNVNELVDAALRAVEIPEGVLVRRSLAEKLLPVTGGAAQIMRVLTNLISNAVDAMGGFGGLTIETSNEHLQGRLRRHVHVVAGDYVCIHVKDTGPGIAQEIQEKIFEPFFTTKKTDGKRGSGLGLSVVHSVIEDHKGYLDLISVPGHGTTFSIYLPVDHNAEAAPEVQDGVQRGAGARVLVVDDDPVQREVVQTTLETLGYQAEAVNSGEDAILFMCGDSCDLLVLDMAMEGIDGTETLRQIKTTHPQQRAIILSGFARSERVDEALRLGASAFVAKPVQTGVLAKAVYDALQDESGIPVSSDP